ncbi:hypothetical protein PO909_022416 [Leuciscus waleckii]
MKRLNLLKFVKGGVSSRLESTAYAQTAPSGSVQPQGTTSQFAPGSPSSYPSVSLSSPQGAGSQSATVQSSRKSFTSSYGTPSGSSTPFNLQGSNAYGGSVQPQGNPSQFASGSPSSYPSVSLFSPQGAASQSATVQSSRKQFISTITGSTGTQEGSPTPFNLQGSTTYDGSLQPQGTTSQFASGSSSSYPSVSLSSPQGAACQSATVQSSQKQFTSSYGTVSGSSTPFSLQSATVQSSQKQFTSPFTGSTGTQKGSSTPFNLQGSTTYGASLKPQGATNQFASGSSSSYPSVSLSSPQGAASQSATVQSSRKQFISTITGNTGTQEGSPTPFNLKGSTTYDGSLQPQGTTSQFASGSSSSYPSVSLSSTQGAASQSTTVQSLPQQITSSYGTLSGSSTPFSLQGSTAYGGSFKPQGTTSQFAPASPSSYNCHLGSSLFPNRFLKRGSLKQFTSTFTGRTGTNERSSSPFSLQGSSIYGGSLKPQGTTNQFASGSSSSYPSVSISSTQGAAGQSATVQSSQKQFTSSYGSLSGSSPISLQGSTAYGGSLQPQATTSQFTPASPSSYNCHCVSLSSPQDVASVSATVQSLQKQFTSSYGLPSQSGSSTPFSLQGSTTYGGSLQPQATTSQFASASPSYNCH